MQIEMTERRLHECSDCGHVFASVDDYDAHACNGAQILDVAYFARSVARPCRPAMLGRSKVLEQRALGRGRAVAGARRTNQPSRSPNARAGANPPNAKKRSNAR